MGEKLMVTIPVEDYNKLVESKAKLDAIVSYAAAEKFSLSKDMVFVLADRPELIKKED